MNFRLGAMPLQLSCGCLRKRRRNLSGTSKRKLINLLLTVAQGVVARLVVVVPPPPPRSRSPFSPPLLRGRSWYVHCGRPSCRRLSLSPEWDHMYSPSHTCSQSSNPEPSRSCSSHGHLPRRWRSFSNRSRSSPPASILSACGRSLFYSPAVYGSRTSRSLCPSPVNTQHTPSLSAPTSPSDHRARSASCGSKITPAVAHAVSDDEYHSGDTVILSDNDVDDTSGQQVF